MSIKDNIKSLVAANGLINDRFYGLFSRNTESFLAALEQLKDVDCITDSSPIREFRRTVEQNNQIWFTTNANISNSLIYGNWHGMFGDIPNIPLYKTPAVEHGLIFSNQLFTDVKYTARPTIATFSDYRHNVIKGFTKRPIFRVGPYIHYADPYFDGTKHEQTKTTWGKTLLVFPSHGTDKALISFSQSQYLKKIKNLANDFNTVVVNVFWWNINDPIVDAFRAEGYKIATAGIRDDIKFLSRLKSLINLADLIVGDGIGTHVGYILHLNKPYRIVSVNSKKDYSDNEETLLPNVVRSDLLTIQELLAHDDADLEYIKNICEPYWGFSHIKSRKELTSIVEISQDISDLSACKIRKSHKAALDLLSKYESSDPMKHNLLLSSIS